MTATTTRHSWMKDRTDKDADFKTEYCTCKVCGLVRITRVWMKNHPASNSFHVTYVDKDGKEHEAKIPFPCKEHCKECKQEFAFEGLT